MAADRLSVVLAAIASVDGDAASIFDRVCVAATRLMSLSGAGLSLIVDGGLEGTAGVTGPGISRVQELQFELGDGPCFDAWRTGEAVSEANLADPVRVRWPVFAQQAVAAGVLAVFAFPLQVGAIRIGVLALYRGRPGALTEEEFADGLVLADLATQAILSVQAGASQDTVHELLAGQPAYWAQVHQATGMIAAQLDVSLDDAFVRLRAHAFSESRQLDDVANDVVQRRLRLEQS